LLSGGNRSRKIAITGKTVPDLDTAGLQSAERRPIADFSLGFSVGRDHR